MSKLVAALRLAEAVMLRATGQTFRHLPRPDFSVLERCSQVHDSQDAYQEFVKSDSPAAAPSRVRAWCTVCDGEREMVFSGRGDLREQGVCPACGLNARLRFCIGWLAGLLGKQQKPRTYLTEQATRTHQVVRRMFPNTEGSEYALHGERRRALQHVVDHYAGGAVAPECSP